MSRNLSEAGERFEMLTSTKLCFPCPQGTVCLGIPGYNGCCWLQRQWSQSSPAELRVLTHPRDDLQKELWVKYHSCFSTCTNSQFPSMCNEGYEAVQPGHLGLDETILCILGNLENFLTDYEIISWPEIHFWAHSGERQILFPYNLWLELDRNAGGF